MYYRAREIALNNEHDFHLVAIVYRNKTPIRISTNSAKTHPKFGRTYKNGGVTEYHLHAEMDAIRFAKPGDELTVMRFKADGTPSMSKPCKFCQEFIKRSGIKVVYYTDWDGSFKKLKF